MEAKFAANADVLYAKRNVVKKIQLGAHTLVAKAFKRPSFIQAFIYANCRKSKALRAFEHAARLEGLGISTPPPIAAIEHIKNHQLTDSYYITLHHPHDYSMEAVLHAIEKLNSSDKAHDAAIFRRNLATLHSFVRFTFTMHQAGVLHCDHNAGNTLIRENGNDIEFTIIDINRMQFKNLTLRERLNNFVRLSDHPIVLKTIADSYAQCMKIPGDACFEQLMRLKRQHWRRLRLKKRLKTLIGRKVSPMKPEKIYSWDGHSDQPHVTRDKKVKRGLYRQGWLGSLKTLLTSLVLPVIGIKMLFKPRTLVGQKINMIGLCVNIDTPLQEKKSVSTSDLQEMTFDLGVTDLLIRLPLSDIENLDTHIAFIKAFKNHDVLVNILQDRRHIEDPLLLHKSLDAIFKALNTTVTHFQIGNAVNRRKWAFISLDEYFNFFSIAQKLRDQSYPSLKLIGGSIIDFEPPNFARSVWHRFPIHYDGAAALLYVDRRGAPENKQLGCDLISKINWYHQTITSSNKCSKKLWITETNWPLLGTEPFAPAVGDCMVSEQKQAAYLVRYFLLMFASGRIERCYWHQLVAPGYGLIDNRGEILRKRPAYYSYKLLLQLFDGATVLNFTEDKSGIYRLKIKNNCGLVEACWVNGGEHSIVVNSNQYAIEHTGKPCITEKSSLLRLTDDVVYVLDYPLPCGSYAN